MMQSPLRSKNATMRTTSAGALVISASAVEKVRKAIEIAANVLDVSTYDIDAYRNVLTAIATSWIQFLSDGIAADGRAPMPAWPRPPAH